MVEVLVYSTLYPSSLNPTQGIFVKELTRHIRDKIETVRVVAPVNGWRNLKGILQGKYQKRVLEDKILIDYPLFWTIPKVLKQFDGVLLYHWTKKTTNKGMEKVSLVHAHYVYPESFAAQLLAEKSNLPLVVTIHGSDINVIAEDPSRKHLIIDTLQRADAVVTVSKALMGKVVSLIGREDNVYQIPNGIDSNKFFPGNKNEAKKALGLSHCDKIVLFAGRLEPVKGLPQLLKAVLKLPPDIHLVLIGGGSQRKKLEKMSIQLGVYERIIFCGPIEHHHLYRYFQAADLVVLASVSEGWPTIILEAMACGKPVVSPAVGGVPEVINGDRLGILTESNDSEALARGILKALSINWDSSYIQNYAQKFSWKSIAEDYLDLYTKVLNKKGRCKNEAG